MDLAAVIARYGQHDEAATDDRKQARETHRNEADARDALVHAQAKKFAQHSEDSDRPRRMVGVVGVERVGHGDHRFGVWVDGVRDSVPLSLGVAVVSSNPRASSLRPIPSSRGGRFGRSERRAICCTVSG